MNKKKRVMMFESKRGPKRKKTKNVFCKLENSLPIIIAVFLFLYISKMIYKA